MTSTTQRSARQLVDELVAVSATRDEVGGGRRHARLLDEAGRAGVLDVAYRTVDSPVGPLLLAATLDGLVRVAFDCEDHDAVLTRLADVVSPRILRAPNRLDSAAAQLDEYFAGRRQKFDLALDLQLAHGFRRAVLDHLREIPYGATESYAAVAAAVGNPAAVRAAGSACAKNPLPLVVPCHRVIRSDGTIGQFGGGIAAKRALLEMEGGPRSDR